MKWIKFTLDTRTEAVDFISVMLNEIGIEGVEISNKVPISESEKKQMFIDILPEHGEDDGLAEISFYVEAREDKEDIQMKVQKGLKELSKTVDIGSGKIETSQTEDKDWINNWKQFFKPFRIDDTIIIKPTWEYIQETNEEDIVLEIDPGTAFGTGSHETTKLCILNLKKYLVPGAVVLDAGSGSGILSILAKKLGAKEVLGIDIDSKATDTAKENAKINKVKDGIKFLTGNIIEDGGIRDQLGKNKYDIVVSNILADVIIPMSGVIVDNIRPGGYFISSGIIDTKELEVKDALIANGLNIIEVIRINDWVSIVAQK